MVVLDQRHIFSTSDSVDDVGTCDRSGGSNNETNSLQTHQRGIFPIATSYTPLQCNMNGNSITDDTPNSE